MKFSEMDIQGEEEDGDIFVQVMKLMLNYWGQ
jgi:hypothetical protein